MLTGYQKRINWLYLTVTLLMSLALYLFSMNFQDGWSSNRMLKSAQWGIPLLEARLTSLESVQNGDSFLCLITVAS